jgi:hypothetical protein
MEETQAEAPRGVFVIDGEECPFPELAEGFDMDEAMVFFEYTGHPIEDLFIEVDEDDEDAVAAYELKLRSPKTMAALMHLAYARAHPKKNSAAIKTLVKNTDFVEAFSKLVTEEDDASPPEMTSGETPPARPSMTSSPGSSNESTEASGNGSTKSSEPPAVLPERIGTSESATLLTSDLENSAA